MVVRIWHIYNRCLYNRESIDIAELIGIKRNAYCRNLTRIVYLDSEKDKESEKKLKIHVVGFIKKYVVAVVGGELIIYSLSNFEVASYEVIDSEVIGLDVQ
jgi:nucleosome binding factor SPN SPT16 subunit